MLQSNTHFDHHPLMLLLGTIGAGTLLTWMISKSLAISKDNQSIVKDITPIHKQNTSNDDDNSNFVKIMKDQKRNELIIFYGSQTGTSEDFAQRIGKECKKRFNIQPIVADLETYDLRYLDVLDKETIVVFIVSTYGEGEPTDSAIDFWELLHKDVPVFSKDTAESQPLSSLRYFMFGLGNRTYEHFNGAAIGMDKQLTQLGATRLGELGAGDDDNSMEDDFIHWQEGFWPLLTEALGTTTTTATTTGQQELAYNVIEKNTEESFVFLGELGDTQQITTYNAKRPYPAPLELYDLTPTSSEQRHCLHLDIDLTGSNMSYTTGDHLGIWPTNNETEVSLIAYLFGWDDMRMDQVISVMPTDPMGKAPFPQPTTLRAALRHYLDIAQIPSRSTLELLIPYCTDDKVKSFFQNLIDNKDEYRTVVVDGVYNLGQLVSLASENTQGVLKNVPLPVVLECYSRLQPRYYSISSSSSESATTVSATAVTLQYHPTPERTVYGVNTNYLWALHQVVVNNTSPMPKYIVDGPRQQYLDEQDGKMKAKIPVHIRQSNFRLPSLSNTPVIMVGPGTGVAPFRGFVRERVYQKQVKGEQVGTTILFFGCRRSDEDYLYRDEWPELFGALGGSSRMITAFSREPNQKKVYVQHRLAEHGEEMWNLLNQGAYFYVCGDAKYMAKDVQQAVIDMSKQFGGYSDEKGVSFVQQLRKSGRYVEDVWA